MICLDMDGVLVDFCTPAYAAHGRTCCVNEPAKYDFFEDWGMTADEFWEPIDKQGPEFWVNLPLYPWAKDLIQILSDRAAVDGIDLVIATTPSRHPASTAGKVAAIQEMFGPRFRNYCITPRKWLMGSPGCALIDDNEENCQKFRERGGRALVFPQPWNNGLGIEDRLSAVAEWI